MSSIDIQIISRLFEFLGSYKPEELASAAGSPLVTANVRDALASLARARADTTAQSPAIESRETPSNGGPRLLKMLESQFYSALADGQSATSASEIASLASRAGVQITFGHKDGRARVVARLRRELDRLSPKEREQKYRVLLRELRPNQTEGWFKVIRGEP